MYNLCLVCLMRVNCGFELEYPELAKVAVFFYCMDRGIVNCGFELEYRGLIKQ